MKVICYSWDGEQFVLDDRFSYEKRIELKKKGLRTANQKKEVKKMKAAAAFTEDLYSLRYRFFKSNHIREIICDINPAAYDKDKQEYANAVVFFKSASSKGDVIEQLKSALTKYGD